MLEHVYRLLQQLHSFLIRSVSAPLQINQPSAIARPKLPFYTIYTATILHLYLYFPLS